jgi:hypothetical protein
MIGSIKTIYLILTSVASSTELSTILNINEDYNFFKFKVEIRNFLIEIMDYLRLQLVEMNNFIISLTATKTAEDQSKETAKDEISKLKTENEKVDENKKEETNIEDKDSERTSKKVKLVEAEPALAKSSSSDSASNHIDAANPNRALILRQVELKRKYLEHIIQILVQTINYLSSSIAASSFIANSSPSQNSSSPSSSKASSNASSPDYTANDNNSKNPIVPPNTSEKQSSND